MKEFIEKLIERLEEKIKENTNEDMSYKIPFFGLEIALNIVNQLAEEYKPTTNSNIQEVIDNLEVYTVGRLKNARVHITVEELQNQIDRLEQLAEEYNNDFCEWRLCDEETNVYDTTCRNPHILIEGSPTDNNYEFCPYCGKKIKVVE